MRDYKNVKVPRKYRQGATRASVKRAETGSRRRPAGRSASAFKAKLLNVLVLALTAGLCALGWRAYGAITHAPVFQVAGIDVKGVRELSDAELKKIAAAFTGQNIFRVDLEAAAQRARSNPWIKEVRIHRSLPNRITMAVVERVPYAVLDTNAGRYLIDNEAVVIERLGRDAPPRPLPVITMKDFRAQPGEPVTAESVTEALTLLAEIEARGGWEPARVAVRADSPEALTIVYAGHEFRIGSGKYPEKLRRLAEIMGDVKQRSLNIAYVDLRAENQAAVMVANGKSSNTGRQGSGRPQPGSRRRASRAR